MRFRTEDRCQLLPRGGRTPRPLRALAISLRVFAPAFRIASSMGTRSVANSSAACTCAMRPREPAIQRFVGVPSLAPAAFFARSLLLTNSEGLSEDGGRQIVGIM